MLTDDEEYRDYILPRCGVQRLYITEMKSTEIIYYRDVE